MSRPRTKDEQIFEGKDCMRLMENHGMTMAAVAKRKHVAFNTVKQWVKAVKHDEGSKSEPE